MPGDHAQLDAGLPGAAAPRPDCLRGHCSRHCRKCLIPASGNRVPQCTPECRSGGQSLFMLHVSSSSALQCLCLGTRYALQASGESTERLLSWRLCLPSSSAVACSHCRLRQHIDSVCCGAGASTREVDKPGIVGAGLVRPAQPFDAILAAPAKDISSALQNADLCECPPISSESPNVG